MTARALGATPEPYAARLAIDYPEKLDRFTTFFRLIWVIPIALVLAAITSSGNQTIVTAAGEQIAGAGGGLLAGLAFATALMIVIRVRYQWRAAARRHRSSEREQSGGAPRGRAHRQPDSTRAAEVLALLRRFNRQRGQTVVLVTHDPEVGAACDRIVRMRDGLVVHDDLLRGPREPQATFQPITAKANALLPTLNGQRAQTPSSE